MHCRECGSQAINHHLHGRDGSDGDLCDVCYWRKRATEQAAVIEQMREALQLCRSHMYCHASNTGDNAFDKLCSALALQHRPEVLNKVRADAVSNAIDAWMCSSAYVNEACIELWFMNYAQRIEKGEA